MYAIKCTIVCSFIVAFEKCTFSFRNHFVCLLLVFVVFLFFFFVGVFFFFFFFFFFVVVFCCCCFVFLCFVLFLYILPFTSVLFHQYWTLFTRTFRENGTLL